MYELRNGKIRFSSACWALRSTKLFHTRRNWWKKTNRWYVVGNTEIHCCFTSLLPLSSEWELKSRFTRVTRMKWNINRNVSGTLTRMAEATGAAVLFRIKSYYFWMNVDVGTGVSGWSLCSLCSLYRRFEIPLLPPLATSQQNQNTAIFSRHICYRFLFWWRISWKWKLCELQNHINFHLMRKITKIRSLWSYNLPVHGTHSLLCVFRRNLPFFHILQALANKSNATNGTAKQYLVFSMSLLALEISGFWCFPKIFMDIVYGRRQHVDLYWIWLRLLGTAHYHRFFL